MAETSYNGWTASPTLDTVVIAPVKGCKLRVRNDKDVVAIFTYLVQNYHKRVDDVTKPHPADDWGFAYRPNKNNPKVLSCHASGTAIDLDATEHPNGVDETKTFTSRQISEIHKILQELDGAVVWGGDWTHTVDGMHFELCDNITKVRKVGARLRRKKTVLQIAKEVIAGEWGNGAVRKSRLTKAGYNYDAVQAKVVQLLQK